AVRSGSGCFAATRSGAGDRSGAGGSKEGSGIRFPGSASGRGDTNVTRRTGGGGDGLLESASRGAGAVFGSGAGGAERRHGRGPPAADATTVSPRTSPARRTEAVPFGVGTVGSRIQSGSGAGGVIRVG